MYAGTASKVLAPALRLGWLVVPPVLVDGIRAEKQLADQGTARIEQLAFAHFLARGDLDRHLRRMRVRYRGKRGATIAAPVAELPEATVRGFAAGLHVTVELPPGNDEETIRRAAARRGVGIGIMGDYRSTVDGPPTLILGYSQISESRLRRGVIELAQAIRDARG